MGRKIIVILLGVLILNGSTEIHQLFKLPFLMQHFLHHRKENAGLSFLGFLKIHYAPKDQSNNSDDREDHELPFKSIGNISHIDTPLIEKNFISSANFYLQQKPPTYYLREIPNKISFSIFHPPRTA